ncbi:MAG TPA: PKD domain-containing protein, partial [Verrucomicrobiae bacterium]
MARWRVFLAGLAAVLVFFCATSTFAFVTITPATNGTSISADKAANATSPAWTTLGPIVITEGNKNDFSTGSGLKLVLKAPAGFEFNTAAVPNVAITAGADISSASAAFSNSTILAVTLTVGTSVDFDQLTIGNTTHLQVRPTSGTPLASGQIFRPAIGGGTAGVNGVTASGNADGSGGTSFGALSEVVGVVNRLAFTTQPGSASTGAIFGSQPVVKTRDQFNSDSTTGLAASLTVSVALTSGTGPLLGTTNLNIGTSAGNGTVSYTNLEIDAAGTNKQLTASATGLSSALSVVFAVNGRPTISTIADQVTGEDTATAAIDFTIGDVETPAGSLILSASSSNTNLVLTTNIVFGGSGSNRTVTITPVTNAFGTNTLTLTVSDGTVSANSSFLLTVNSVNDAPTLNALTNLAIPENATTQTVSLAGISAGPANESAQIVSITATSSNPSLVPNPTVNYTNPAATGTLKFAPLASQSGSVTITVVVADNGGTTNGGVNALTNSFAVAVVPFNDPPTLNALTNLTVLEDAGPQTVNLSGISPGPTNESSQTVSITATSSNPGLIPNPTVNYTNPATTGTLTFTSVTNLSGSAVISVVVKDSGGTVNGIDSVTNSFTVTVVAVNDPPTLNALTNLTILEDSGTQVVNLTGISSGPANENTQSNTITATSSNPGLIPNPTVTYTNPGTTGTLTFAPLSNQFGSATITVVITDTGGTANGGVNALTNSFTVTVSAVNDRPTLNALTNVTILEDAGTQTVNLSGISSGPATESSQTNMITATSSNPGLIPNPTVNYTSPGTTGALTFTPITDQFGTAIITVVVQDSGGTSNGGIDSVTNSFTVTVQAVNDPPTLNALTNVTILEDAGTQTVNLSGITSGPTNENSQTNTITATSSNPGLIPNPTVNYTSPATTGTLTFAPLTNLSGSAVITVVITDTGGTANGGINSLTNAFTVTVLPLNDRPTMNALTNLTILEEATLQTVNLSGIGPGAANESSQNLSVTATSDTPSLIPSPTVTYTSPASTGTLTFVPLTNQFGTAVITVVVTDDGGTTNGGISALTNSFTVTVQPVNDPPTLNAIGNVTTNVNAGLQTVVISGITTGPANESSQTNSITAISSNPGLIPNPTVNYTNPAASGTLTFTPATNGSGSATITVTVTDSGGTANGGQNSVTRQFTVTVNPLSDLGISQTATPNPAFLGGTITFTLAVTNAGPTTATNIQVTNTLPAGIGSITSSSSQGTCTTNAGKILCSVGTLTNKGTATVTITVEPLMLGAYTNSASIGSIVVDPSLANNTSSLVATVVTNNITISGTALTNESCANGAIDPGEMVTVNFSLRNLGLANTTNLVATLKTSGGVTAPGAPQNYGALTAGGAAVARPFTFIPVGDCGGMFTATLQLQDGAVSLGAISSAFTFGTLVLQTNSFSKTNQITIPTSGPASPYPSTLSVSGLNPQIVGLTVTLTRINHNQPDDLDILLVAPGGQKSLLMSDCGGINGLTNITIKFDNAAAAGLPDAGVIGSNSVVTNLPTNFGATDSFSAPAPAGPYVADLSVFNGANPNGTWQLFAFDDTGGFAGNIAGGWTLNLATMEPVCCVDAGSVDVTLAMTAAPDPVIVGNNITFTLTAANLGPATATGVTITNPIPTNSIFVSATSSQGTCTNLGTVVVCNLGTVSNGAAATANLTFKPTLPGAITNTARVSALQPERALASNFATNSATVSVPTLTIGDAIVVEGNAGTTNAVFNLTLTPSSSQPISVDFGTQDLSATAGLDYFSTNGTVVFNPGDTARTITVRVIGDTLNEATEFFKVVLSNEVNVLLANTEAQGSITDDDALPNLSINDISQAEGNVGSSNFVLTVTLSPASGQSVSVNYATANGTAVAGSDFTDTNGTLMFSPGQTSQTLFVTVLSDTVNESNETFFVNLNSEVNANVSKRTGLGTILNDDPLAALGPAGFTLVSENCAPTNGVIDPNEAVTVSFTLTNVSQGAASTTNLVATLLQGGGITAPGAPQTYGVITAHGAAVSRSFTFTANGSCGDTLVAVLQLQDGSNNLGTVTNFLPTGKTTVSTRSFTNSAAVTINDAGTATPYPSTITVTNLAGTITKITATLSNLNHTYPSDIDVLLVGPTGQTILLMSDTGGGNAIAGVTLKFDDAAASVLSDTATITSGTYKPTDYEAGETFPAPAPSGPYETTLSNAFNGTIANGVWSLYIVDDTGGDSGTLNNGWSLTITAISPPICCGTDSLANLAVGKTASAAAITIGSNVTYTINVTNLGPNTASDVVLVDPLPVGMNFVSATNSADGVTNNGGTVTCNLGTMTNGATATVTIVVNSTVTGIMTNTATVSARTADPTLGNNSATRLVTVLPPAPVVNFTGTPVTGPRPLTVTFTDNSTGVITNRFWNFGNGSTTNTAATNFVFTYPLAGTNTVTLTVSGPGGTNVLARSNYIAVTNLPPLLSVGPASLDFGAVILGQSNTLGFQLVNLGGLNLTGTAATAAPFSIASGSPFNVAPGATSQVFVSFAPTSAGTTTNTVVFTSNGGGSTNAVAGVGLTPGQIALAPTSLDFGNVAVGTNAQLSFIVTNTGGGPVSNGVATVTNGPFTIVSGTPFNLAGSGFTNVVIRFTPTNSGGFSNNVVFTTANGGNAVGPVSGIGAFVPAASFTGTPTTGTRPLLVSFTDDSTGTITSRFWNFGDGFTTNTSATNLTHTYVNASTNTVTLTVSGPVGTNTLTRPAYILVTNPPPLLSAGPANLDYGAVVIGQTNTQSFQVVNLGGLTLTGAVTTTPPFAIAGGSPFSIAPGATSQVFVSFAPTNAANFSNAVVFVSNGGNATNTATGSGLTPAQLSVSPASLNFGTVAVGSNASLSFTVTNLGGAPLSDGVASVTNGPFTILSESPFSLPGFGSTNVVVVFTPTNAGGFTNGVLFTTGNDGNSTNVVSGTGAFVPSAGFVGGPTLGPRPLTVTFTNNSTGTITNSFWDFGDGDTTNTPASTLTHLYSAAGTNTVTLTVSGPVGADTLALTNYIIVTNIPPLLSVGPASLDYGAVVIGQTNTQNFQIVNLGGLPLTGAVTTTLPFAISSGSPFNIAPGATNQVSVRFAPTNAASFSNAVVFASNGGNSTNAVTGIGLTPGQISVTPASLNFGTVAVGSNAQLSFLITNTGGAPVSNGVVTVTNGSFAILSGTPFALPGFGSTNVVVQFTPTNASTITNPVIFTSSGGNRTNPVIGRGAFIPSADFTGSPTTGAHPLTVNFSDNSTGTITNRFWDFGDGNTTNTAATNLAHVYALAGTNTVTLTVSGPVGTDSFTQTDYISVTNLPPLLSVTPANLNFGNVVIGQTNTLAFQVANPGQLTLTGAVTTTLPFAIASGSPFSLAPGTTGQVFVTFAPTNAANFTNAVSFTSNGGDSTNAATGVGLTAAQLSVSPASRNFGTVAVGANAQLSFAVTNLGGAPLSNGVASVTNGPFTIVSGSPFNLPGFGATNVVVRFTPTNAAFSSNNVVFTTGNDGNSTNPVSGTGAFVPAANFAGSPTTGAWPLTVNFSDSSTGTITNRFWNFGDGNTTNTAATNLSHLYASASTNTVTLTVSGPVGTNTQTRTNYILVTNLPPQLSVTPASLNFGAVVIGQTNTLAFQLVNPGQLTLTGAVATAQPFAIAGGSPFSIAPGATSQVLVSFAPTNAANFTNAAVFTSNGGGSTNSVTGTGLTPGQISVSPASLNFGTIAVGTNAQLTFVVTNTGGAPVSNGVVSLTNGPFTIVSGTPFDLPGFGATNVVVRFTPTNAGSFSNNVSFSTANGGSAVNPVSGIGAFIPSAGFTGSPTTGAWPLMVNFNDASTGTITNRFWNFGDGKTTNISATNIAHLYSGAGTNTVTLTASGPVGTNTLTRTNYILVTNLPPLLSVSPGSLNFGDVVTGQTNTLAFQVANLGQLTLTGAVSAAQPFAIAGGSPFVIAPGATSQVFVSFAPTNAANFSNAVVFVSNGGGSTNGVTGRGLTAGQISVSPASLDFATVAVGTNVELTFVVTNTGGAPASNGVVTVTNGPFAIVSGTPFGLAGFGATNVVVRFTPTNAGSFSNNVVFTTANAGSSVKPVSGAGAFVPSANFSGSPTTGAWPLTVNFTDSSTGTITNRFWNFGDGDTTNATGTNVTHLYSDAGTNTVVLTISGPVGSDTLVRTNYILVTNLPPLLSVSPPALSFGAVVIGQTNTLAFEVVNLGQLVLTGAVSVPPPFTIESGSPFNVPLGQTNVVLVSFAPTNAANFSNAVVFISNGGNSTNPVTGIGLTPAQLSVTPAGLNFGTIAVGSNAQLTLAVTNLGGAPLSNGVATITGGPFTILSGTPFSLAGFGATNLVVRFTPTNAGAFSNAVVFTTGNDGGSTNPVTGTGAFVPSANFTATPTTGPRPLLVTFTDTSTGTITNRFWDFGDGNTTNTTATNFGFLYALAGTNTVTLTVSGPVGTNTFSRTNYIEATNPPPLILLSTNVLIVPEGGTNSFAVQLSRLPDFDTTVTVSFTSGDGDLAVVAGGTLTFTLANWNVPQSVFISAAEDADTLNGQALFTLSAPGLISQTLTAEEADNDIGLVVSTNALTVLEGGSNSFTVQLNIQPDTNVNVAVAFGSGDTNLSVLGSATLMFTPTNWMVPQTVVIGAAEDNDNTNAQAVLALTLSGITNQTVTVTEADNDMQSLVLCPTANALFSMTPGGAGPFVYLWRKDGGLVVGQTNNVLLVTNVNSGDAGIYSVEVTGVFVNFTNFATLTVLTNVSATPLLSQTNCPGTSAGFGTVASGTGPFSFVWRKDGVV